MHFNPLLGPAIALVAWTLVMLVWMALTRFPAIGRADREKLKTVPKRGARGIDLDGVVDETAQWKAHNYNHLMEQPTIFYAIVVILVLMDDTSPVNLAFAWGYVAVRIAHSIVQATINIVNYRLTLFGISSLLLAGLTVHAALEFIHHL